MNIFREEKTNAKYIHKDNKLFMVRRETNNDESLVIIKGGNLEHCLDYLHNCGINVVKLEPEQ